MFLKSSFLLCLCITGLESYSGYIFDDNANGWLKLHTVPAKWSEAKLHCDTENSAVLASPLTSRLQNAIKQFLLREQGYQSSLTLYTGIHANYADGDFGSVEGYHISYMPITLQQDQSFVYKNSESCVVWESRSDRYTKRGCDVKLPYICYKSLPSTPQNVPVKPQVSVPTSLPPITTQRPIKRNKLIKCVADGNHLIVTKSELQSSIIDYLANNPSQNITIIFADNIQVHTRVTTGPKQRVQPRLNKTVSTPAITNPSQFHQSPQSSSGDATDYTPNTGTRTPTPDYGTPNTGSRAPSPGYGSPTPRSRVTNPGNGYPNTGNNIANPGNAYPNSGSNIANPGNAYSNSGSNIANPGNAYPNSGSNIANPGNAYPNSGSNTANLGNAYPNTGSNKANPGNGYPNSGSNVANPGNAYPNSGSNIANPGNAYSNFGSNIANPGNGYPNSGSNVANPGNDYSNFGSSITYLGNGSQIPGNTVPNPGNSYPNSGSNIANPGNGYQNSGRYVANPGNDYSNSGSNLANPGNDYSNSGSNVANPGNGYPNSGSNKANPGNGYPNSGSIIGNPGNGYQNSGRYVANPGNDYSNSGSNVANPGNDYSNSGSNVANPGNGYPNSGSSLTYLGNGSQIPGNIVPNPGNGATNTWRGRQDVTDYTLVSSAGGWFKLHGPATWSDAKAQCAYEGGVLVSPLNNELRDGLKQYVMSVNPSVSTIFTGVRASLEMNDYVSVEDIILKKMPVILNTDVSNDYRSSDSCISMRTDRSMSDTLVDPAKCTSKLHFVCFKKENAVMACGTRDPSYIFEKRIGKCYKFHNKGETWSDAYTKCKNEGANLAVINSQLESAVLKQIFANNLKPNAYYNYMIYLGARDWTDGKSWMTVEGKKLQDSGYLNWASTEPNNARKDENCLSFHRSGELYDDPCDLKLAFICEKNSETLVGDPPSSQWTS